MFTNYLKIAWRNIRRSKTNSFINITGLAAGLACVILIVVYIKDELSYDRFLPDANRIYQVNIDANFGGTEFVAGNTPPTVGPALNSEFPEVESYTRIYRMSNEVVKHEAGAETRYFNENGLLAVDSNFLQVFRFPLVAGNAASCLQKPGSVVLTQSTAKKYFGNGQAVGQLLSFDEYSQPFVVTGIVQDLPAQSTLQFDLLIPTSSCPPVKRFSWSWVWCRMSTYVVLKPTAAAEKNIVAQLESHFPAMVKKLAVSAFKRIGQPLDEFLQKGGRWDFHLQPFTSVHLHSAGISNSYNNLGNITHVYTFGIVALFIIILACVNFMNLSTARAARRAKEVGIRKVLGSQRKSLIFQFLSEAFLFSTIAAVIALLVAWLALPAFNQLAQKQIPVSVVFSLPTLGMVLALLVITALLAGSYPAFYLTRFNPVSVLKGSGGTTARAGNSLFRNGLVAFQFAISVILIICTIVVYRQLQYTRQKDLGMHTNNVLTIPYVEKLTGNPQTFREELSHINGVSQVSITTGIPSGNSFTDFYVPVANGAPGIAKDITLSSYLTDEHLIPALQLQLLKGRNFSSDFNDSASVIINETTAKQIGWKDPIGQYLSYPGGRRGEQYKVIGVVKDFNTESLHAEIAAFALFHHSSQTYHINSSYALISVQNTDVSKVVKQCGDIWKSFVNDTPFDYSFLDKNFEALYRSEERMGALFTLFTMLALAIACLGLFGLSVYIAETRTREIGIRKVLGASEQGLAILLSKDFLKPIAISILLAVPVAWWSMNKWLLDFAYRITLSWWIFAAAAVTAVAIALFTVSFQAFKTAVKSPVQSLKAD